jgi:hypothetical protein
MKSFALSALAAASLFVFAGCAASSSDSADVGSDDLTAARPQIELKTSSDESSLQAKLFKLMAMSSGHPSSPTESLTGTGENGVGTRSISCTVSRLISAVVGSGVSNTAFYGCTFTNFDKTDHGGKLPSVVLSTSTTDDEPLAGKLVDLLIKGEQKGGFGVKKSPDLGVPPCCDIPMHTTFTLSDSANTLSCTLSTGGFAFMRSASCTLTENAAADDEVEKGTLVHTVGIGGENTGFSAKIGGKTIELVLDGAAQKSFVEGRVARITGTATTLSGVETHDRPAIKVSDLLVCPAPHATLDAMPPVSADTHWMEQNCPDLDVVQ